MKSVKQINIERLSKCDREKLVVLATRLSETVTALRFIACAYEGRVHTVLDRAALEAGDAMSCLAELTVVPNLDLLTNSDNLDPIVKSSV